VDGSRKVAVALVLRKSGRRGVGRELEVGILVRCCVLDFKGFGFWMYEQRFCWVVWTYFLALCSAMWCCLV
jgi:hypothetical protein